MLAAVSRICVRAITDPRFLPVCFFVFVVIRLSVLVFVPTAAPASDAGWYLARALTLVQDGTYSESGHPTAFWPVGYPAFVAMVFKVAAPTLFAAQLANLLIAAASFWLLYLVAWRLLDDEFAARGAVLLLTIYPNNVAYVPLLLTETLFTFLLLVASYALLSGYRWSHLILAGVVFGLATLVKVQGVLLIPVLTFLASLDQWSARCAGKAAVRALAVTAVALAVVLPWALRNYVAFGTFPLVASNGGLSLLAGNNPSVVGDYRHDFAENDPLMARVKFSVADQIGADQRARALAYAWIREHPWEFIALVPKKLFRLWAVDGEGEWGYQDTEFYERNWQWFRTVRWTSQFFYLALIGLFAAAVVKLAMSNARPRAFYGVAIVAIVSLISAIFSGQSRYHFPAMPFVIAYAAWLLAGCARRVQAAPDSS